MRLLLADLIRRRRIVLSVVGIGMPAAVLWWAAEGMEEALAIRPILAGLGVAMAFSIGAQTTARHMERAVCYLPISRRDTWLARWIFSIIVAPVCTWPGLLAPAVVERTADAAEAALLSVLYTVVYAGVGCGLVAVATRTIPARAPWRQFGSAAASLADIALPLGLMGPMFAQQFSAWRLPMRVTDITAGFGVSILVGLAAGIGAYFYTPPPVGRTVRSYAPAAVTDHGPAPSTRRRQPVRRRRGVPVPGLALLLANEYRWAMAIAAGLSLGSVLIVTIMAGMPQSRETVADLLRDELRFIDGAAPGPRAFVALTWYGFFVASLGARFPSMLRHLRVLPTSAARLTLLLTGWPLLVWLTAGAALGVLRYVLLGQGPSPAQAPLLIALTGLSAVAGALTLRMSGLARLFLLCILIGLVPLLHLLTVPSPFTSTTFGIVAFAAAAALNHFTLRRSSTYRVNHRDLLTARLGL